MTRETFERYCEIARGIWNIFVTVLLIWNGVRSLMAIQSGSKRPYDFAMLAVSVGWLWTDHIATAIRYSKSSVEVHVDGKQAVSL